MTRIKAMTRAMMANFARAMKLKVSLAISRSQKMAFKSASRVSLKAEGVNGPTL